ncbi:MAG TPA: VOC family protein [Rhizomicrobium sp.]|jgi:catechol 2,3-dioxygenase-like lactoylglutathione lyase family enzyme|nr:VOC family protein [Rhizomicrobium sp.]
MRLNQVTVPALDVERSIAFYVALGMRLIVKDVHYARFELPDGESTFSLHLTDDASGAGNGASVYFECDDLDARVTALKAKGIVFDTGPVDQSWLWREAWLTDPAGVKLCFFKAGDARRYPPWRLSSPA